MLRRLAILLVSLLMVPQVIAGQGMTRATLFVSGARVPVFRRLMGPSLRRNRLRHGMLSWGLFRDAAEPSRYIEHFVDESWVEHLRHFERMTAFDVALRERRMSFHIGDSPPRVSRYIAQALGR